jgi:hypothetical protein
MWVEPRGDLPPILLTGTYYSLMVHVKNISDRSLRGRVAFSWPLAEKRFVPFVITFDLQPGGEIARPTTFRPDTAGHAELRSHLYLAYPDAGHEGNLRFSEPDFGRLAATAGGGSKYYTLFSAAINDAAEWRDTKKWQDQQRFLTRLIVVISAVAAGAAVAGVVLGVVYHI